MIPDDYDVAEVNAVVVAVDDAKASSATGLYAP